MKPVVSDKVLREAVVEELQRDPEVLAKHVSVTAIDGAVTLGGHVLTIHEKHVAVRAAERVPAVRVVADEISVRPTGLGWRGDDEIAEEIARLRRLSSPIPDSVEVQVRDGRVYLAGMVDSEAQREAVETAVNQLAGIREVGNLIQVEPATDLADALEPR